MIMSLEEYGWMREAKRLIGVEEIKGDADHPELAMMATLLGVLNFEDDVDPWCTMFISHCLRVGLPDEPLPKNVVWSRAYRKWGIELAEPIYGAVVVLWRGKDIALDLGHCFFYTQPHPTAPTLIKGIGGNQGNKVSEASHLASRIVPGGIRWPISYPIPDGAKLAQV